MIHINFSTTVCMLFIGVVVYCVLVGGVCDSHFVEGLYIVLANSLP